MDDVGQDDDYFYINKVMRFIVGNILVIDISFIFSILVIVDWLIFDGIGVDRYFKFDCFNGEWQINGVVFVDVNNCVFVNVFCGKVEIWEFENGGGGWSYLIYIYLVDFKVLWCLNDDGRLVYNYEVQGLKDVVWFVFNEIVRVEVYYVLWDGVYMFYCYNLIYEDVSIFLFVVLSVELILILV